MAGLGGANTIGQLLGVAGAIAGIGENSRARSSANRASDAQGAILAKLLQSFEALQGIVGKADKAGQFDPEKRVAQFRQWAGKDYGLDRNNLAGNLFIKGYRQGDSEAGVRQDALDLKWRDYMKRTEDSIRSNTLGEAIGAYTAGGQLFNPALAGYGQMYNNAMGRQQDMGGYFQSIMPYFGQQRR